MMCRMVWRTKDFGDSVRGREFGRFVFGARAGYDDLEGGV